MELDEAHVV